MQTLICCATPGELKVVKSKIKALKLKQQLQIDYLCTGIGNYATIATLSQYLTQHPENNFHLVNIGLCGYHSSKPIPLLVQIARIKNADTHKEFLPPIQVQYAPLMSIYSSETILTERTFPESEGFVDMESWAIEYIADRWKLPRTLLKVPYDQIGAETLAFDRQKACLHLGAVLSAELLMQLLQR